MSPHTLEVFKHYHKGLLSRMRRQDIEYYASESYRLTRRHRKKAIISAFDDPKDFTTALKSDLNLINSLRNTRFNDTEWNIAIKHFIVHVYLQFNQRLFGIEAGIPKETPHDIVVDRDYLAKTTDRLLAMLAPLSPHSRLAPHLTADNHAMLLELCRHLAIHNCENNLASNPSKTPHAFHRGLQMWKRIL